jgi:hypothetical protein
MSENYRFSVLVSKKATEVEFIEHWSSFYRSPMENLYRENIGKPLTEQRIIDLFTWKNGLPLSKNKRRSVLKNYFENATKVPRLGDRERLLQFLALPGGTIWRIFWLHCGDPEHYPIFDQHVFRAMKHILEGVIAEIPGSNLAKAKTYLDDYLPFHAGFRYRDKKRVDEALWACGRYLALYPLARS